MNELQERLRIWRDRIGAKHKLRGRTLYEDLDEAIGAVALVADLGAEQAEDEEVPENEFLD